jgi:hypothetical protein
MPDRPEFNGVERVARPDGDVRLKQCLKTVFMLYKYALTAWNCVQPLLCMASLQLCVINIPFTGNLSE